ncbi:membrane-associated protein, putative [Bodo saltans]|uniref:Membrane-associated protein, putative n=1 Tax=Bodo saltans TaxID=75058 RepID=A0A0S4JAW5_BODSA|nr:membrane-associated protein, putative [Bodo saltans]|eukprot:CUG86292.1 membrane-associated protein, putative [Bodo saltans]
MHSRAKTVLLAALLAVSCSASLTFAALVPPGAPHASHRDVQHDIESPFTEGDLLCNLCEEHLAPAVWNAIHASEKDHDPTSTMEATLHRLVEETDDHVHQPIFHEYIHQHMWNPRQLASIAALQTVHHNYPHRAHLMERLVDHIVCSCRVHTWSVDRVFQKMLERHSVEEFQELKKLGLVGRSASEPTRPAIDTTFSVFDMPGGNERPAPKNNRATAYAAAAGMPDFAGIATGDEVQGVEL